MNGPQMPESWQQQAEALRRAQEAQDAQARERLKSGGSDGTSGGMDPWQTSVETRLGQIHTDMTNLRDRIDSNFKWLVGVFGGGFIALSGMVITSYLMIADKLDGITK